ncbi:uncharacterized protein LOC120341882 [Styela clava]
METKIIIVGIIILCNSKLCNMQCTFSANCKGRLRNGKDPYPKRDDWNHPAWLPIPNESDAFVDLIFLMDGSGSISEYDFKNTMFWLNSISRGFDISKGTFQIGVVQYSHWYRTRTPDNQQLMKTEIKLGSCLDYECLKNQINAVKLMGYTTYTGFAINKTVNEDFRNSINFDKSLKILVLLTDGTSNDDVIHSSNYARSQNVTIFAIGIGPYYYIDELKLIATGDTRSSLRLYVLENFDRLPSITDSLRSEIKSYYVHYVCPPLPLPIHASMECSNLNDIGSKCTTLCNYGKFKLFGDGTRYCHVTRPGIKWSGEPASCGMCKEKFDLLVILDSSSSVTCEGFELAKQFVATLIDALNVGPSGVQVSCLRYYMDVHEEFSYDEYVTKHSLIEAMLNIGYCGKGTRTGEALQYAFDNQFSLKSGRRGNDVPHITLLITDGEARDNITGPALKLKSLSKVYPIGVKNASPNDLRQISSDENVMDILAEYEDLMNVTLVWDIANKFCEAVRDIKDTLCDKLKLKVPYGEIENKNESDRNIVFTTVGTTFTLSCFKGYRTIGEGIAFCGYDGNWEKTSWECIEKGCETLSEQNEVIVSCTEGDRIGSSCTTRCKPGYEIVPSSNPEDEKLCEKGNNTILSCFHTCERTPNSGPKWDSESVQCQKTSSCRKGTCKYGSKCLKDSDDEFYCSCTAGYTGLFCETEIDECENVDCNRGVCVDLINDYQCKCNPGFHGTHCQLNKNECLSRPCKHGGDCVDGINNYTCICDNTGWTGRNCEEAVNECHSNPCMNKGFCRDRIGYYECECQPGFEGKLCETNIDDCASSPCITEKSEDCIDKIAGFECICVNGYEGSTCHMDVDECLDDPCGEGGRCSNSVGSFICKCAVGYRGDLCETITDYCDPDPCSNKGKCVNYIGSSKCDCLAGYTGSKCNIDIDECIGNACRNGVCEDGVNEYSCSCHPGFNGRYCQFDINECLSSPCGENGYCQENKPGSYRCDCKVGYAGTNCDENINECVSSPCQNDGTCIDGIAKFTCDCKKGFQGTYCAKDINECGNIENVCGIHGNCVNTYGSYFCKCDNGFEGEGCEININECGEHECKNGAQCIDGDNEYKCKCRVGFAGKFCNQNIDDCLPNICKNGATCTDLINDYKCNCKQGYAGKRCQIQNDACLSFPCKNGAECMTEEVGYRCECLHGFEGKNCNIDIDECETEPPLCGQTGICVNRYGSFDCVCSKGYQGIFCDEKLCSLPVNTSVLGEMSCTDGVIPGSECTISCPAGYRVKDSRSNPRIKYITELNTECINGSWENASFYFSGSPPKWQCETMTCAPLEKLSVQGPLKYHRVDLLKHYQNEVHKINCSNGTSVGSECTLECHEAFVIGAKLSHRRRCNKDGSWSGSRWRCVQRKCFHPKTIGNIDSLSCYSRINQLQSEDDRFKPGSTCTLKCLKNFEVIGAQNKTCSGNYNWEPDGIWECRERKCPTLLPAISNGRYLCGDSARPGSVCSVICNSGFVQDDRNVRRIICEERDGKMVWNLVGNKGLICIHSECESSFNLATLETTGTNLLSVPQFPYRDQVIRKENRTLPKACNSKAIIGMNITKEHSVTMQLWYGGIIAGYHTVLTTFPDTNGHDARSPSEEHLVTGVGRQLSSSGFQSQNNPLGIAVNILPVIVVPNSRATVKLTFNEWTWMSKGGDWTGKIHGSASNNQSWYMVYLGMNRVPNTREYYDRYRNGTGLCYVCLNKN